MAMATQMSLGHPLYFWSLFVLVVWHVGGSAVPCSSGIISYVSVCNRTAFGYSAGCLVTDPQATNIKSCSKPSRGFVCSVFSLSPTQNATCLVPNSCGSFNLLLNATASKPVYTWDFTTTYPFIVNIQCEYGFERSDGLGFSGSTECQDNGIFKPMDFTCIPVQCGKYCRYCNGKTTDNYCPSNQPCCCTTADISLYGRYLWPGVIVDKPLKKFSFPGSVSITCESGYGIVPGSGSASPRCLPRDDCLWQPTPDGNFVVVASRPLCMAKEGFRRRSARVLVQS